MSNTHKKHSKPWYFAWFAFFSSMRFAVALLCVLAIASVIGTVIVQNRPPEDYAFQFGPFWSKIFAFLGIYDVYSSSWFVLIMFFLVLSTALCVGRNAPKFLKEIKSFRTNVTVKSLLLMKKNVQLEGTLEAKVVAQYFQVQGFQTRLLEKEDGILVAAKKGLWNKLGYIFAHLALIVICLGGLIDSNMLMKVGIFSGSIVPDKKAQFVSEFKEKSRLSSNNLSFRGDITLPEGQSTDSLFLNAGNSGFLLQELPFVVTLKQFHVEYYNTGMPRNFASDVVVTEKATGKKHEATIKVNHPLTIDGISIYQSSFGDGGSPMTFKAWNVANPLLEPQTMQVRSMSSVPMSLAGEDYQLIFNELKPTNIENRLSKNTEHKTLGQVMADVRSVEKPKNMRQVGPTITYRLRDSAGQQFDFMNYMLTQEQEGRQYYFYGAKAPLDAQFRWMAIPVDASGSLKSFMLLRRAFADPKLRQRAAQQAASEVEDGRRTQFTEAVENVLTLFATGGYESIDQFIQTQIPAEEQTQMGTLFYRILAAASSELFKVAQEKQKQEIWKDSPERNFFMLDSLQAMTALHHYPSPILMQLDNFEEVRASGLQMSRSPGEFWVYLGSFLLMMGSIFMFYVREKRAWVFVGVQGMVFAMSANRHRQDLDKEFPIHTNHLKKLIEEYNHEHTNTPPTA